MPIENKFVRCEPDDPHRCQASGKRGQCEYRAMEKPDGSGFFNHCPRHNASRTAEFERKRRRNYRLGKYQARMEEFADNDQVKSLREEVGITRILLEEIVSSCSSGNDMIMYSNKISDLVTKVEKLVVSCHKLEQSTGMLLDKAAITRLADSIIKIVVRHVEPDAASAVASEIMAEIVGAQNENE